MEMVQCFFCRAFPAFMKEIDKGRLHPAFGATDLCRGSSRLVCQTSPRQCGRVASFIVAVKVTRSLRSAPSA